MRSGNTGGGLGWLRLCVAVIAFVCTGTITPTAGAVMVLQRVASTSGIDVQDLSATADGGFLVASSHRVWKISSSGVAVVVAGTGVAGFSGDGGPATAAQLTSTAGVAAMPDGGFLIAEDSGTENRVRRVDAAGDITTALPGVADLTHLTDIVSLGGGSYLTARCSSTGGEVRRYDASDALVHTYSGFGCPRQVSPTVGGAFLSVEARASDADWSGCRVYSVDVAGAATVVAGTGTCSSEGGSAPGGGQATASQLSTPTAVLALPDGGFLVTDGGSNRKDRVLRVRPDGTIVTFLGDPAVPFLDADDRGVGCPATMAGIIRPGVLAREVDGAILVADWFVGGVKRVAEGPVTALPVAKLTAPSLALTGASIQFDASASIDFCGGPLTFQWDLTGNQAFESGPSSSAVTGASYSEATNREARVRVIGTGGNAVIASVPIGVRSAPPAGAVGASINTGARYTNSPDVAVSIVWPAFSATAAVANDGGFADQQTFPVQASVPWRLDSSGAERLPKTVYVRFDQFGPLTFQDDIILDETPPKILVATTSEPTGSSAQAAASQTRADAARVSTRKYKLKLRAKDNASKVPRMQITNRRGRPGKWLKYKPRPTFKGTSSQIYVRVRDGAGNNSRWHRVTVRRRS